MLYVKNSVVHFKGEQWSESFQLSLVCAGIWLFLQISVQLFITDFSLFRHKMQAFTFIFFNMLIELSP